MVEHSPQILASEEKATTTTVCDPIDVCSSWRRQDFDFTIGQCLVSDGNSVRWIPIRHKTLCYGGVGQRLWWIEALT